MNGLTAGRIVHYVAYNQRHLAAIIVGVADEHAGEANIFVWSDMPNVRGGTNFSTAFQSSVPFSASGEPGTWHWPERVPSETTGAQIPAPQ